MSQPGTVFTAESAAKYLKEQNRNYLGQQTWLQAYKDVNSAYGSMATGIDIANQRSENILSEDFAANIADAYEQAMNQERAILNSNLGQGFKSDMIDDVNLALNDAYKSYLRNYQSEKSTLEGQMSQTMQSLNDVEGKVLGQIDDELMTQAKNTADYLNAHFDYLAKLYEKNEELFDTDEFSDYANLVWSDGAYTRDGVISRSDLTNMMFDENGNLNERGIDFIKQIQSTDAMDGIYGFGDYLYDTNKDLYDWSIGLNQYDTTYSDIAGNATNRASALGSLKTKDGLGLVNDNNIIDTSWTHKPKEKTTVKPYDSKTNTKDFGTIDYYRSDGYGDVAVLTGLSKQGEYTVKGRNNESVPLTFKGDETIRSYGLKILSDKKEGAIADDNMTESVNNAVGGIKNEQIYFVDNKLYIGLVDENGKMTLRQLVSSGGNKVYDDMISTLNNPTELAKQAEKITKDGWDWKSFMNEYVKMQQNFR